MIVAIRISFRPVATLPHSGAMEPPNPLVAGAGHCGAVVGEVVTAADRAAGAWPTPGGSQEPPAGPEAFGAAITLPLAAGTIRAAEQPGHFDLRPAY